MGFFNCLLKINQTAKLQNKFYLKNELYVLRKIRGDEGATTYKCETFTRDSDGS